MLPCEIEDFIWILKGINAVGHCAFNFIINEIILIKMFIIIMLKFVLFISIHGGKNNSQIIRFI